MQQDLDEKEQFCLKIVIDILLQSLNRSLIIQTHRENVKPYYAYFLSFNFYNNHTNKL